jgi:hypothetical protein
VFGARRAALRFYNQTEPIFLQLRAPSEPGSLFILELLSEDTFTEVAEDDEGPPMTKNGLDMLRLSVNRGYAMRLAEGPQAGQLEVADDDAYAAMTRVLLKEQLHLDDALFDRLFSKGTKVWRLAAEGWTRMVNVMLQNDDPTDPLFPVEPIEQVMRVGYFIAAIDEAFALSPRWS